MHSDSELAAAARLGTPFEAIDTLIGESLETLGRIVPYDLATVMQLHGDELTVRVSRGRLDGPQVQRHRLHLRDFPILRRVLEAGEAQAFTEGDHRHGDGDPFDGVLDLPHGHFCMVAPLQSGDRPMGLITLDRATCGVYPPEVVELVEIVARLLGVAIRHGEQSARLERIQAQLLEQNRLLTEQVGGTDECCRMLEASRSASMRHVVQLARQVAPTDAPILITGETGTGKDVLATAIHSWSDRAERPMVRVNCAALPSTLIESELFGHVRGAFSGATQARMGRFQAAHGGTLFLDEIGEIPAEVQAKLLRVLQEGTFEPVGSDRTVKVDVRIVAATNRDLHKAIRSGQFREDLYYRLAVFPLTLPPLRARRDDIPTIARQFLERHARRTGRGPWYLPDEVLEELQHRDWPGNVRELVNTLERATILAKGSRLSLDPVGSPVTNPPVVADEEPLAALAEVERAHIVRVLRATHGRVHGSGGAAEILGMHPNTLLSRMRKHGLGGARDHRR